MTISQLSDAAARAITSSLVLNDATSVVRELIDNSLDSCATNVIIEVSANTIDLIQVRDNGAGIGVEDRQLLCKRGYTSKIRTIDDLAVLGGSSLGFRGEALASIAELSEFVTITTRVDGETVATMLKHDQNGKLVHCCSTSHGPGTTVRVENYLKSIPVRRQTPLKQTAKILANIKRLLFEYAFARPTVRFLLKITKAKTEKANWSYIPCKIASSLDEAASKIIGKDITGVCKQEFLESKETGYAVRALLLSAGLPASSKIFGTTQYCSIDGRPVNTERGFIKELLKKYRSYLVHSSDSETAVPQKPFIVLHLVCPRGSYDVNIEPSKDEVLFEDSTTILQLVNDLLEQNYGRLPHSSEVPKPKDNQSATTSIENDDFDLLLAKRPTNPSPALHPTKTDPVPASLQTPCSSSASTGAFTTNVSTHRAQKIYNNMYNLNDDESLMSNGGSGIMNDQADPEDGESEELLDPRVTNPFTLAKFNVRLPQNRVSIDSSFDSIAFSSQILHSSQSPQKHFSSNKTESRSRRSSTEVNSCLSADIQEPYQNPGPPNRPWRRRAESSDIEDTQELIEPASGESLTANRPSLLESWVKTVHSPSTYTNSVQSRAPLSYSDRNKQNQTPRRSISDHNRRCSLESPTEQPSSRLHQKAFRTPVRSHTSRSRSPMKDQDRKRARGPEMTPVSPFDAAISFSPATMIGEGKISSRITSPIENTQRQKNATNVQNSLQASDFSDLNQIMDFEHRKREAVLQHRKTILPHTILTKEHQKPPAPLGHENPSQHPSNEGIEANLFIVPARPQDEGQNNQRVVKDKETGCFSNTDYATQFHGNDDNIPPQPASASYTQNPRWNKFKAFSGQQDAPVSADESNTKRLSHVEKQAVEIDDVGPDVDPPNTSFPPIHDSDPRAVLIKQNRSLRQNSSKANNTKGKNQNNGPKPAKLHQLPFETLRPENSTYMLAAKIDLQHLDISGTERNGTASHPTRKQDLLAITRLLAKSDDYVQQASGYIAKIDWQLYARTTEAEENDEHYNTRVVDVWESRLRELLTAEALDVDFSLTRAIKAHVEQNL